MNSRRAILLTAGAAALGITSLHTVSRLRTEKERVPRTQTARIPNVTLQTHEGRAVKVYDDLLRGKLVVINMMYTACEGICPGMTANLRRVQNLLADRVGRDVFLYSISLQPEQDTPRVLNEYAKTHRIKPGWLFLTGTRADIERLRYGLGFYDRDPVVDRNKASHTGMLRIGNDVIDRWAMAPALAEPDQILATINHLDKAMYRVRRA